MYFSYQCWLLNCTQPFSTNSLSLMTFIYRFLTCLGFSIQDSLKIHNYLFRPHHWSNIWVWNMALAALCQRLGCLSRYHKFIMILTIGVHILPVNSFLFLHRFSTPKINVWKLYNMKFRVCLHTSNLTQAYSICRTYICSWKKNNLCILQEVFIKPILALDVCSLWSVSANTGLP